MSNELSCTFCRIIAGQAKASFVYRDDVVSAFMDIHPINPGHLLVVPNIHASNLAELNDHVGGHMFVVGKKIAMVLRRSELRCDGVNLFLADGAAAGQTEFHSHLHVVPRHVGDGFGFHFPAGYTRGASRADLDAAATKVRVLLDED